MSRAPSDRHIVVTGVSRGLGRALVDEFCARGHRVSGCCRSPAAAAELNQRYGAGNRFEVVDVSSDGQVRGWAEAVLAAGQVDLLINNAAIINRNARLWEVTAEEFDRVIDINVKGTVNVLRHFLPAMTSRRSGIIVNFSSEWGRSTSPEVAPYCGSKFAIEGITRALAQELPRGMAAIPLNPGIIDTDMLRSCFAEGAAGYPGPREWAQRAVPFLLSLAPQESGKSLSVPLTD